MITSLQKIGVGTWILAGSANNTFTGSTTISGGTLTLQQAAGNFDILPNAGAIIINVDTFSQAAGGTLNFLGASNAASTETVGALTATLGAATINAAGTGTGSAPLTFSSLVAPAAGTGINITTSNNGSVTITGATNVGGILNAHLYFNGGDFAAGSAVGAASYTPFAGGASLTTLNTSPYSVTGNVTAQTTATIEAGIKFSGGTPLVLTLGNTQTLTLQNGAATVAGGILVTGGTAVTIANAGTATGLTSGGAADLVFRTNTLSDSLTISVPILATTTGGFTKNGAGTLILNAVNLETSAGTINVNEGTLQLLGATTTVGAANMIMNIRQGATFDIAGVNVGVAAPTSTGNPLNAINGAGTITDSGAAAVLRVGNTGSSGYFTGLITSTNLNLVKAGTGTLSLTNNSNSFGILTIDAGIVAFDLPAGTTTLAPGVNSPIGTGSSAASLVFNGGTLQYTGATATIFSETQTPSITSNRQFTLAGSGTIDSSGTYGNNVFATTQNNAALILNSAADLTFSGTGTRTLTLTGTSLGDNELDAHLIDNGVGATNALSLTKSAAGLWILNPLTSNSFSGATTISGGQLQVAPQGATIQGLSSSSNLVLSGGVLQTSGSFTMTMGTVAGDVQLTGGGFAASTSKLTVNLGGGTIVLGAAPTSGSTIILSSTTALADVTLQNAINLGSAARTIQVDDNTSTGLDFATVSGVISNTSTAGTLTKTNGGTLTLTGANTYTGNTILNNGALVVTSIGAAAATSSSSGTNVSGGVHQLGAGGNSANLLYVGSGETTTRQISLVGYYRDGDD